jgi:hypothetical protein
MVEQPGTQEKNVGSLAFLGRLLTALGAPSAVGLIFHQWVAKHVTLSILLGILISMLFGMAGLAQEVWRRKYKDQVIDWIGAGIDRRMGLFWQRYREHLLADLRYVDLRGLAGRFFDPDLSDVYVDVALRQSDPDKAPSSDLPQADSRDMPGIGERHKISDLLGRPQPRVLVIIGTPGSGKTTLLRYTACEMCRVRHASRQGRSIPILLYLRDHCTRIAEEPQVGIPVLVAENLELYGLTDRAEWLEKRLRSGDCVVMLDGLDEIAREEDRKAVAEWVRMQVIRYSGNDFVVTSRPLGYQGFQIEGALTVQTQPFTRGQVTQFVQRWCLAEGRWSTGSHDETIIRKARAEAEDLLQRLQAAPNLWPLTVNPLLLTMIAIVHRHYGALPGSRAELYARICQVLLWSRQEAKKLSVEPRGNQKERLMRVLAFEMMRRNTRDLSTSEATAIVRPVLRRISKDLSVMEVLYDAASNGLFIERENGVRTFAHQTFQEYLAAAHIKDKGLQDILLGAVGDVWWRETTLLYVAGADAGPIVEACLNAGTLPALSLAFDCAEEAGELAPELRDRLTSLLTEGLARGANPERRKPASGVTLTRHLRRVVETAAGARICSQAITWNIYRLFLDDMEGRGEPRPPDAPEPDASAAAGEIVTGIRASDARAFVDWANEITSGHSTYRLPTHEEILDPVITDTLAVENGPLSLFFWAGTGQDSLRLYPSADSAHPGAIDGTRLRTQLATDFTDAPLALGILPLIVRVSVAAHMLEDLYQADIPAVVAGTRHCLRDLDEATEPAAAHELSRTIGNTVAGLARQDLDRVRALLRAIDQEVESLAAASVRIAPRLAVARYLAGVIQRDLGLIRDYARSLHYGLTQAPDTNLMSGQTSNHAHYDLGLARNLELLHGLEYAGDAAAGRVHDVEADFARYRASISPEGQKAADGSLKGHNRDLAQILGAYLDRACTPVLGTAFLRMLPSAPDDESLSSRSDITAKSVVHSRRFADTAAIDPVGYVLLPDLLPDAVLTAVTGLDGHLDAGSHPAARLARLTAGRFASLTEGVIMREQRVDTSIGRSLRIMALWLAAEASVAGAGELSEDFRRIAAGITWLERRHDGAEPAGEAIVLALS